jgi:phosphatidylglycerol:prolipoprotein diacylglycerol transferase
MMPVLFRIGQIPVYAFGTMMSLAFLVAGVVIQRDLSRKGEARDVAWLIVGFGLTGGLAGARLWLMIPDWQDLVAAPWSFLERSSGFVWYGGLLGGVLATAWPIRRTGVGWASAADSAALGLAIGYAIGRIGCHLAGDGDWGTPTRLPWGVAYLHATAPWPHLPGVRVHPAPVYEMAACGAIFVGLWKLRARIEPSGALFRVYLVLAGLERFLVEFVRTNEPFFAGLTQAQWISLALMVGAAAWLCRHSRPRSTPKTGH